MTDDQEILWRCFNAYVSTAQHYEKQRASVTSLILFIAAALVGLTTYDHQLNKDDIAASVFIIVLGIFGCLFAFKHHERYRLHIERAKGFRNALDETLEGQPLMRIKIAAEAIHDRRFGRWRKAKVEQWWVWLNFSIVLIGFFLLAAALIPPR